MHEQITVTEEGLKKLQDELNYLKTIKKQEIKDAIKTAKEYGVCRLLARLSVATSTWCARAILYKLSPRCTI